MGGGPGNDAVAIGIDIGGTTIAGGIVAADGTVSAEREVPTPRSDDGADPGARATTALVEELLILAGERGLRPVAIGLGVPEYVSTTGRISSREVLAWPPEEPRVDRWPIPVVIESDVRAAALAELLLGIGREADSFLYVSIGTGISHTMVVDRRLWPGHRGEALALGELPVPAELAARPLAPLTVEQQASGRAIELATAGSGDRGQTEAVARIAGRIVAEALIMAVRLLDPPAIVLGGGLGTSGGTFARSLRSHYQECGAARPDPPPLRRSALGSRGGIVGAGLAGLRSA